MLIMLLLHSMVLLFRNYL